MSNRRYEDEMDDGEVEQEWKDSKYCVGLEEGMVLEFKDESIYDGLYAVVKDVRSDEGMMDVKIVEHPDDDVGVIASDTLEVPCIQYSEYDMLGEVVGDDYDRRTREHATYLANMVYKKSDEWRDKQIDKLTKVLSGEDMSKEKKEEVDSFISEIESRFEETQEAKETEDDEEHHELEFGDELEGLDDDFGSELVGVSGTVSDVEEDE